MVTADHVARAIVAACRETNEDPVAVASGIKGAFRSRHYAMWALLRLFPDDLAPTAAARLVGCSYQASAFYYNSRVHEVRGVRPGGGKWWNHAAYERVIAAIGAVEFEAPPEPPPFKVGPLPPATKVHHESKLGTIDRDGYRPPSGISRAVLEDDADDDRPVFDKGSIGGRRQREFAPESKRAIWDELRAAVANTQKMAPPKD